MKKRILFFILISISVFSFAQQMCLTNQEKELIQLINTQRTDLGYSECNISATLMLAANNNCKEIVDQSYLVHKPSKFGNYTGDFAYIRIEKDDSSPTSLMSSMTNRSDYTDYSDILFSEENYQGKNWKSIGICIRQNTLVIAFGDMEVSDTELPLCVNETFFEFDPTSQYPTLAIHFPEKARMRIFSVDAQGNEELYIINTR